MLHGLLFARTNACASRAGRSGDSGFFSPQRCSGTSRLASCPLPQRTRDQLMAREERCPSTADAGACASALYSAWCGWRMPHARGASLGRGAGEAVPCSADGASAAAKRQPATPGRAPRHVHQPTQRADEIDTRAIADIDGGLVPQVSIFSSSASRSKITWQAVVGTVVGAGVGVVVGAMGSTKGRA